MEEVAKLHCFELHFHILYKLSYKNVHVHQSSVSDPSRSGRR